MSAPRTGVFVCACGPNIAGQMDIESVAAAVRNLDGVVISGTFGLLCSPDGKRYITEKIREFGLQRVVVAACSPRDHEKTFQDVCAGAGLNPFMMEMANIREQVAWVTRDRDEATAKALRLVTGAVRRSAVLRPLERTGILADPGVAIIGAGVAGMTAALVLADAGRTITVIERRGEAGGAAAITGDPLALELRERFLGSTGITVLYGAEPVEAAGFFGNFLLQPRSLSGDLLPELRVGAILLTTGCEPGLNGESRPAAGFAGLAEKLRVETVEGGFPARRHFFLDPVSTPVTGVLVAGCAGGPCSVESSILSAGAAAGMILSTLVPGREMETEPRTSVISETLCAGCRTCMIVCGYAAISYDGERRICRVNGILCKGCGNCAAACPSGAIRSRHYMPDQLRRQVAGVLS
jgi:heterodisulfide reductase subunit A-like polyferredoxin